MAINYVKSFRDSGGVCRFGIREGEKWHYGPHNNPCHAQITYVNSYRLYNSPTAIFVGALWCLTNREQAQAYWRFILGPESPWGLKCTLIENEGNLIAWEHPYTDDDAHNPVFRNLCVATRLPRECNAHLQMWWRLRNSGFSDTEALYVASQLILNEDKVNYSIHFGAHFAFDTGFIDKMVSKRLLDHEPDTKSKSVNGVWNMPCTHLGRGDSAKSWPLHDLITAKAAPTGMFAARKVAIASGAPKLPNTFEELIKKLRETRNEWK